MEEALHWVKTFVDQCRTGRSAELRLNCVGGQLRVNVSADLGSLRATTGAPQGCWDLGLQKVRPSQWRRRNRRAAERAAAEEAALSVSDKKTATEKEAEEKAAEKAPEKKDAVEKTADAKNASEAEATAGKVDEVKAATKKSAEENNLAKKAVEEVSDSVATTSCVHSKVQCLNCNGYMTHDHQCELPASVVVEQPPPIPQCPDSQGAADGSKCPPGSSTMEVSENVGKSVVSGVNLLCLPLCHYCCHLGSGNNPVHYVLQCLCEDKGCSCQCYCSEEQLVHKKKFFPGGFTGSLVPVSPGDRPRAKTVAEAQANKLDYRGVPMASRPCDYENCV